LVLLSLCVGFAIYQIPMMQLPAYWDEAFPYSYAVRHMYDRGPTLIPTEEGMPEFLFTGHPPLFYFLEAVWMRIFGDGVFMQRTLPVLLSLGSIVLLFNVGRRHFSLHVGLIAAILFATRTVFLAQASRVLPETMVLFFMLVALEFWLSRRFWLFLLPATAMLLTKEPALTFFPLLCLWGLLREWKDGLSIRSAKWWRVQIRSAVFTCLPVAIAATFFFLQYYHKGWFFFPRHMNMSLTPDEVWVRMNSRFDELFNRFWGYILPIVAGVCVLFIVLLRNWPKRETLIALLMMALFVFGNIWFSSQNFYATARYILFVTPMIVLMGAVLLTHAYPKHQWLALLLATLISGGQLAGNYLDQDMGDSSRGYVDRIKVMQQFVGWMKEHKVYDRHVCARFLTGYSLKGIAPGYVTPNITLKHHSWLLTPETELYIHWEIDGAFVEGLDTVPNHQIAWFQQGPAWVAVYEIDKPVDTLTAISDTAAIAIDSTAGKP
jgi:4-amino-4-deoxy-L-arabinose transferase-like glycosyltransferase